MGREGQQDQREHDEATTKITVKKRHQKKMLNNFELPGWFHCTGCNSLGLWEIHPPDSTQYEYAAESYFLEFLPKSNVFEQGRGHVGLFTD